MNDAHPADNASTPERHAQSERPGDLSVTTGPYEPGEPLRFKVRCPHCNSPIQLPDSPRDEVFCPACGSGFRVQDTRLTTTAGGMKQLGRFLLLERVGVGGFGAVWKARDTELGRLVALKIPHPGLFDSESDRERFRREARAAAQLRHPHILTVHEVAALDGLPAIVADFIDGPTLRDYLRARRLSFRESAELVARLADALDYAHSLGIVHRDIKPGNVMMCVPSAGEPEAPDPGVGHPLLMDFGLALRPDSEVTLTVEGQLVGTPAYMSPEQAAGKGHQADRRCDVYSLGVVLYELLAGELPFRGTRPMLLHQVLHDEPRPPRRLNDKVPRDLETICLKAMAKAPARRFATARDLGDDLRRWLKGEPILARPAGRVVRLMKWARRRPATAALLAVSALALAVVLGGGLAFTLSLQEQVELTRNARNSEFERAVKLAEKTEELQEKTRSLQKQKDDLALALRHSKRLSAATYIQLADSAWQADLITLARDALDEVPPEERFWDWRYLNRQTGGSLFTLYGHTDLVSCVSVSADGARLASGSHDHAVKVWDGRSGQEVYTLKGHTGRVCSVAFEPDGARVASGGGDSTVRVWDVRAGKELLTLKGHTGEVRCVAFSADGARLASGGADRTVRVWDGRTGQGLFTLKGHTAGVRSVAFSPDGTRLAGGGDSGAVTLWDVRTGQEVRTLTGHTEPLSSVSFSPDGTRLASGSQDKTVVVWDALSGLNLLTLKGHTEPVCSVGFCPDGARLASGSRDGTARVWDARGGQELFTMRGHTGAVLSVAFSPEGARLVTGGQDRTARIWDTRRVQQHALREAHTGRLCGITFSPDGNRLATGGWDGRVKVWDVRSDLEFRTLLGHSGPVQGVAFSPDGARLASASGDGTLRVWDTLGGQEVIRVEAHPAGVQSVAFGPDGARLASGGSDGMVKVWDSRTGQAILRVEAHADAVQSVVFRPDGAVLASCGRDGGVKLWDGRSGRELRSLRGDTSPILSVAFSPDGTRLAGSGRDGTVWVWDGSGKSVFALSGHTGEVRCVAFSADGARLASGGADRTVRVWDGRTGQGLFTLKGHTAGVRSVAFSPDGTRLAGGGDSGAVTLWEAWPGQETRALWHTDLVRCLALSPDGSRLASSSGDSVSIWNIDSGLSPFYHARAPLQISDMAFSSDGVRLVCKDEPGRTIALDERLGWASYLVLRFPDDADPARTPDGRLFAWADRNVVRLISLRLSEDELACRRRITQPDPAWHAAEAKRFEQAGQWFAAAFHQRRLLLSDPANGDRLARLTQKLDRDAAAQRLRRAAAWVADPRLGPAPLDALLEPDLRRREYEELRRLATPPAPKP